MANTRTTLAALMLAAAGLAASRRRPRGGGPVSSGLVGLVGVALVLVSCGPRGDGAAETPAVGVVRSPLLLGVETVTLLPGQDTSVKASAPNTNFGGAAALDQNRALVAFDPAAIAAVVGPNDFVVSASLVLNLAYTPLRRIPRTSEAYAVTQPWSEAGATFNCAVDGDPSNGLPDCAPGAAWSMGAPPNPWAPPATSTITIPAVLAGQVSYNLTADVRAVLSGGVPSNGWMLKVTSGGELDGYKSRETLSPPQLVLTIRRCSPSACDDGNACTQDTCDATGFCAHPAAADGTACSDGNACTQGDACLGGVCAGGSPVVCGAPGQCQTASCDPGTGACVAAPVADGTPCNDGDACTQTDTCLAGACAGGSPVACASSDGCHPGVCDHVTGACANPLACHFLGMGSIPSSAKDGLAVTPASLEDGTSNNLIGGMGSAIAYTGVGNLYVATPDRGPNNGLDSYTDRYYLVEVSVGAGGAVTAAIRGAATFNTAAEGPSFKGLSSLFDATGSPASLRFDPEGVRVTPTGTMFVSDEYGPYIYEFGADGNRLRSLTLPSKFLIASPFADGTLELPPGNTTGRQSNRGMEGLAITPDGSRLFGIMQSALIQDGALDGSNKRIGTNNRILRYDLATNATHEYLYQLANKSYGVSEILAVNDHQFLVDERDGNGGSAAAFKRVFKIDVTGASDISGVASLPSTGTPAGVTPVAKQPFLDLLDPAYGLAGATFPEKIEGLAFGPDLPDGRHLLIVTNDNDFLGVNDNNFYVFAIDPVALPGFQAQNATFSNACVNPAPVTCPASSECQLAGICRPDDAACSPLPAPAGTVTSSQVAGDCHRNQCDAGGNVVAVTDNTDLPVDGNQCTADLCTSGVASNPAVPANTACNQNGGNRCDGIGDCVQCLGASDCPGSDTECSFRTCTAGLCGTGFAASGHVVSTQAAGDCHQNQCDGVGNVVSVVDDTDAADDGNACTNDVCTGGVSSHPAAPLNTPCSAGVCDGAGVCVGCTVASQCPGSDTFCRARTCAAGSCGFTNTAANTPLPTQTAGDCHVSVCDGAGNVVANNDNTDVPVDGNACTSDVCTAGVPSNPNVSYGTSCGTNLICDTGSCVDLTVSVVRMGDGTAALSGTSAPVFVEKRKVSTGALVGSTIAMPTTAGTGSNAPFSDSGSATSDGLLWLSLDGRYLSLAGYAAPPGTAGVTGTTTSATNRVVGRIDAAGNVDTSTRFTTAFNQNNIRSAVSIDGSGFWAAGAGGGTAGTWFIPFGVTGTGTQVNTVNTRVLGIFANQLYGSTQSGTNIGVNTIGAPPPPTTAGQTMTLLPGSNSASAYGFALFDLNAGVSGVDTLYVADDSSLANNGGLQKWTFNGTTWSRIRVLNASTTPTGFRGVTGQVSGSNVLLVATTSEAAANRVVVFVDDGTAGVSGATIATSGTNMLFRGVAFSPHN